MLNPIVFTALALATAAQAAPPPAPVLDGIAPSTEFVDPASVAEPPPARFGYNKGFFMETGDGNFAVRANGRIQMLYTLQGEASEGEYVAEDSAFSIPRARFKVKGNAFTPRLHYAMQLDMGKGTVSLKDAYLTYDIVDGWLSLRAGQFKRGFSRQQLASTSEIDFVDRAITDKYFGAGRDIGAALMGGDESKGVAWEAGVFNGTGIKGGFSGTASLADKGPDLPVTGGFNNVPDLFTPLAVARLSYGYGGIKGNTEGDLEGGPLRFAVGTSAYSRFDPGTDPEGRSAAEVDGNLKLYGFATTAGLYGSLAGGPAGSEAEAVGGHVQASYLIADQFLPALRYAAIQPLAPDAELQQEFAAAFSVYIFGHHAKWASDLTALQEGAALPDLRARTQLQLAF